MTRAPHHLETGQTRDAAEEATPQHARPPAHCQAYKTRLPASRGRRRHGAAKGRKGEWKAGWLAGWAAQPLLFVAPRGPRCLRAPRLSPYPRPTDVSLYDAGIVGSMLAYPCNKTTWARGVRRSVCCHPLWWCVLMAGVEAVNGELLW